MVLAIVWMDWMEEGTVDSTAVAAHAAFLHLLPASIDVSDRYCSLEHRSSRIHRRGSCSVVVSSLLHQPPLLHTILPYMHA